MCVPHSLSPFAVALRAYMYVCTFSCLCCGGCSRRAKVWTERMRNLCERGGTRNTLVLRYPLLPCSARTHVGTRERRGSRATDGSSENRPAPLSLTDQSRESSSIRLPGGGCHFRQICALSKLQAWKHCSRSSIVARLCGKLHILSL